MRASSSLLLFSGVVLFYACSGDDSSGASSDDSGTGSDAGSAGSAGSSDDAGTTPEDSGPPPDYSEAAAACGPDPGDELCSQCIAAKCCEEFKGCSATPGCLDALAEYLKCSKESATGDTSACFADMVIKLHGDGGAADAAATSSDSAPPPAAIDDAAAESGGSDAASGESGSGSEPEAAPPFDSDVYVTCLVSECGVCPQPGVF